MEESPIAKAISAHIEPQAPVEEEEDMLTKTEALMERVAMLLQALMPKKEIKPNIEVMPWRMNVN
jgi:hypothetical protein